MIRENDILEIVDLLDSAKAKIKKIRNSLKLDTAGNDEIALIDGDLEESSDACKSITDTLLRILEEENV